MWTTDKTKMEFKEIENKPGVLPAKIIMNSVMKDKFRLWFVGDTMGTRLFTIVMSNGTITTPTWTNYNICKSFINRSNVKMNMLKCFGRDLVAIEMSLFHLQSIINPMNASSLEFLIINPNSKDFFVPFPLFDFRDRYIDGVYDSYVDSTIKDIKAKTLSFDDEKREFVEDFDGNEGFEGLDDFTGG